MTKINYGSNMYLGNSWLIFLQLVKYGIHSSAIHVAWGRERKREGKKEKERDKLADKTLPTTLGSNCRSDR